VPISSLSSRRAAWSFARFHAPLGHLPSIVRIDPAADKDLAIRVQKNDADAVR
jgi:hypothetical protein